MVHFYLTIYISTYEIEKSTFIINDQFDSTPDSWSPQDFVRFRTNPQNINHSCGMKGMNMRYRMMNQVAMCDYLQRLESLKITNSKAYWIRIIHLYRYFLKNIPTNNWPSCILVAWNNENECGLKNLVNADLAIKDLFVGEEPINNSIDSLVKLLIFSIDSLQNGSESTYLYQIENLENQKDINISTELSVQKNNLQGLECVSEISMKWIETYLVVIKLLQGDSLTILEKNAVESIAQLCSSDYGDVVHWARSIVQDWNTSIFSDSNCGVQSSKGNSDKGQYHNYEVFNNILGYEQELIDNPIQFPSSITIYNSLGYKVYSGEDLDYPGILTLGLPTGVYFKQFKTIKNEIITRKIFISYNRLY